MSGELFIRVIGGLDEFSRLAAQWTELLQVSESRGIFLTWEWLYEWTQQYLGHNRLLILVVVDETDKIRGIAPLYVRSIRSVPGMGYRELAFLGTEDVCSSHLDLIASPADKRAIWHCLYRFLFHEGAREWDVLTLEEIPAESTTIGIVLHVFQQEGKTVEIVKATGCPVMSLPRSVADFRKRLSAGRRYTLQRKHKALERLGSVSYRHIEKGPEFGPAFDAFVRLHEKRWMHNGAGGGAFQRGNFLAFHRRIVKRFEPLGWLSMTLVTLDDRPVAGIYGFVYGNTYYFYLPGFDPIGAPRASPGMLALNRRIEQAIEEGLDRFDLLQGDAPYKTAWAGNIRRSLTLRAYNRHSRAVLFKLAESVKQLVKIVIR